TTSTDVPLTGTSGTLGLPGTVVLFGNENIDYGWLSGARASAGFWLSSCCPIGIEGSGFLFPRRHSQSSFLSNASGLPLTAIPFLNVEDVPPSAFEDRFRLSGASPSIDERSGGVLIDSSIRLWGAEANVVCGDCIACLVGFRYLNLDEELNITGIRTALSDGAVFFLGEEFPIGTTTTSRDSFRTIN